MTSEQEIAACKFLAGNSGNNSSSWFSVCETCHQNVGQVLKLQKSLRAQTAKPNTPAHLEDEKRERCGVCGKRVLSAKLPAHVRFAHRCHRGGGGGCGMTFRRRSEKVKHECSASSRDLKVEKVNCPVCERAFKNAANLKLHVDSVHDLGNGAKAKCPFCDYTVKKTRREPSNFAR